MRKDRRNVPCRGKQKGDPLQEKEPSCQVPCLLCYRGRENRSVEYHLRLRTAGTRDNSVHKIGAEHKGIMRAPQHSMHECTQGHHGPRAPCPTTCTQGHQGPSLSTQGHHEGTPALHA
eukprot:1156769-Pelagomonas_calceolata.AAC.2